MSEDSLPGIDFSRFCLISFDCYGTLVDWESGILGVIRPILRTHRVELSVPEILSLFGELESEAESGEYLSYREVLRKVVRGFGARLGFEPSLQQQGLLGGSVGNWLPFRDTTAALGRLKTRFKLAIISNVDDDMFAMTARRLEVPFDHVITAEQARAYKPSAKIFELAENRIGIPHDQWLHAGQSIYHDVIPAKSRGISTVWVNRPSGRPGVGAVRYAAGAPDLEIDSLRALADLAGA